MNISFVIPLFNEEESLPELTDWITRVMKEHGYTYEVLLIDDGSRDKSWTVIEKLHQANSDIKGFRFQRNYGKAAALQVGFEAASGDVVITMDADLQDSPDEAPELYRMITEQGFDLVSGWKKKRYDPPSKTIPTKLYNWATRKMSGIYLHDFNCGLKAYKQEVVKAIEVYGEMHRYIPVIAKWAGFDRIGEKVVQHRPRKYGYSKFGIGRFVSGPLDLLTISFVSRFGRKPMQFFGRLGLIMFLIGFASSLLIGAAKLYRLSKEIPAIKVTDDPWFYIALATMIIGTQLFVAGFTGELIGRSAATRNDYLIRESLGLQYGKKA